MDTLLGERGHTLSGGQRQRLCLARALLLEPEVLVLDDPLSAVDTDTEERILTNLARLRAGRTTLVVSHRLASVTFCSLIHVMERGWVVQRGSHQELLAVEGNLCQPVLRTGVHGRAGGLEAMPPQEYGYMEGEHLDKPYDLALLKRLAGFARPQLKRIILGALLILASTLLDLAPPYLTRLGIGDYVVRQAQEVDLTLAEPELEPHLAAKTGQNALAGPGRLYLPEPAWRGLDPRLTAGLRAAGAVADSPWHLASPGPEAEAVAAAPPELFRRVQDRLIIRAADLNALTPEQLLALREADAWGLAALALVFVAASSLAFALGFVQQLLLGRSGQEMMLSIRQRLFAHLLSRSLAFLGRQPVGKLVTRLTNDVQNINELYTSTLVALFQDLFLISGIVAVLFWLDLRLTLICLGLAPFIGVLAWLFSRLARDAFRDMQSHLGRINVRLSETLNGLTVVKFFRAEAQYTRPSSTA